MSQTQKLIAEVLAEVMKKQKQGYISVPDLLAVARKYDLQLKQD